MQTTVEEAQLMKAELIERGRLHVMTTEGVPFTIEHKAWGGCLNFYGIVPDGQTRPVDGHRLLSEDAVIDWLTELKRSENV